MLRPSRIASYTRAFRVCDPSDRGSEGLIKSVTMATASETEMCAYTLVWPSRFGCAVNARGARADMSTAWAHGRQPHWLLNLRAAFAMGCLVAFMIAGAQCYRHRRTVRLLAPDCARGRRAAWRALWRTLLPAPGDLLASGTIERMGALMRFFCEVAALVCTRLRRIHACAHFVNLC